MKKIEKYFREMYQLDSQMTKEQVDGLTINRDYVVIYSGKRINVGTYAVTVAGIAEYEGQINTSFTITAKPLTEADVKLSATSYPYDGKAKVPTVTLAGLTNGTDYTVTYGTPNSTAIGTYNVTVTGKGNYKGTVTTSYTINPIQISSKTVTLSAYTYTYDGNQKTPSVTMAGLTQGKDLPQGKILLH